MLDATPSASAQSRGIDAAWPGAELVVVERTGSTMDDCLALGRRGMRSGTTVVAGYQERGRGRAPGRRWLSPAWESLLATVLVRAGDLAGSPSQLPVRAALAVCAAVGDALGSDQALIRWPNDVTLVGRKLAGVLCEAHGEILLVGIGVNCLQAGFPPPIDVTACSILSATGREVAPLALLPLVLRRLREEVLRPFGRERVEARLADRGRAVRVAPIGDGAAIEGTVLGVDVDGALLLRDPAGKLVRAAQGEISGSP